MGNRSNNFLITYCSLHWHLVKSCSKEGGSSCQNKR